MEGILGKINKAMRNSDIIITIVLVFVLALMIVPLSPFFMDFFLALIFAISFLMLMLSVYSRQPLDFSTFPSVLLVITLFRLSLNVASTRMILGHGGNEGTEAAGKIIHSIGEFVLAGNYAVGIIVFIILVIINFIVITKGAGRVAEVAARFTLDAMPGKQMAIDADLNSGLIDEKEAKRRREQIAREADFYGSMDGASKFVRGDAIAGIIITAVNVVGGIVIGMAQYGMDLAKAASVFTLLTVGDGLVAQIPAIIIATAAGILITRNNADTSLGNQISQQFAVNPKVIYVVSFILFLFALIPGFPSFIFITLSGIIGFVGYKMDNRIIENEKSALLKEEQQKSKTAETLETLLNVELVELEVGYGLVSIVDGKGGGDLLERISQIRKQFALDWGVILPSVRIRDNLELKAGGYSIKIKGIEVAKGELMSDHFLAMDPGTVIERVDGMQTTEPVFGLPAVWITESQKEDAMYNGYTVVDLSTVMATHLTEILRMNLSELFGRQELVRLLDNFKVEYPKVVSDLVPDILSLSVVLKVMRNLLRENVSIRDLRTILEALAEHGISTKDPEALTEFSRQALYRSITERLKSDKGDIPLFTLDRNLEEYLVNNINQTEQGLMLNIDAKTTQNLLAGLHEKIEESTQAGEKMVVLCSPFVRRHLKRLTEKFIPNLTVVSHNEIGPEANIRSLGTVRL
jgi:flagellar biosynthesis protein FlhA